MSSGMSRQLSCSLPLQQQGPPLSINSLRCSCAGMRRLSLSQPSVVQLRPRQPLRTVPSLSVDINIASAPTLYYSPRHPRRLLRRVYPWTQHSSTQPTTPRSPGPFSTHTTPRPFTGSRLDSIRCSGATLSQRHSPHLVATALPSSHDVPQKLFIYKRTSQQSLSDLEQRHLASNQNSTLINKKFCTGDKTTLSQARIFKHLSSEKSILGPSKQNLTRQNAELSTTHLKTPCCGY